MIDARGYSCPMPVVMVQNEVKKNAPVSLDDLHGKRHPLCRNEGL